VQKVVEFKRIIQSYPTCYDFGEIYSSLTQDPPHIVVDYTLAYCFLFWSSRLCIPKTSLRDHMVWELHAGGGVGHEKRDKTILMVEDRFYWLRVKGDVVRVVFH